MDIYKALSTLEVEKLDMGDSIRDLVEEAFYSAGEKREISDELSNGEYFALLEEAYKLLSVKNPTTFKNCVESVLDYGEEDYIASKAVYDLDNIHEAVKAVVEYADQQSLEGEGAKALLKWLDSINKPVLRAAYHISHEYWRYVDGKYVGTKMNDVFSTGTTVTPVMQDPRCEYAPYTYVAHSRLKGTSCALLIGFEPASKSGKMTVEVKVVQEGFCTASETVVDSRNVVSDVLASADIDITNYTVPYKEDAKMVALLVNNVSESVVQYIEKNSQYKNTLRYGEKPVIMELGKED